MPKHQLLLIGGILAIVLIIILVSFGLLPGRRNPTPEPVAITFWGVEDDESAYRPVLTDFQKEYPHITINYRKLPESNYEQTLLNALAENSGPDIFMLHNSWVHKHEGKVYPLSQIAQFQEKDFQNMFAPVTQDDLIGKNKQILGLPLYIDSLALFYNQDMFSTAGVAQAPKTWEELVTTSQKLTAANTTGDILKSGVTLGTYSNIDRAFEILSSVILQSGDPIVDKNERRVKLSRGASDSFAFYSSFADPLKPYFSWNERQRPGFAAFGEETVAMTFGFLNDIPRIQARNPHLPLKVAPFPQLKQGSTGSVVYASYYFPTVSKSSSHPGEAWQFLMFLTSQPHAKQYIEATGKVPARLDLISEGAPNQIQDVFYRQALFARSWQIPDDRIARNLFKDAINSILTRAGSATEIVFRLQEQLHLLLP